MGGGKGWERWLLGCRRELSVFFFFSHFHLVFLVFVWLPGMACGLVSWFRERMMLTMCHLRQTRELQTATSQTLGYLVCDLFVFGACTIVAFVFSYKLTLVMLATGVPSALILWGIGRFLDPAIVAQKRELAQAAKHVTAATTAIDLVKVHNGQDHEAFQFTSAIRRSARYYSRQVLCNCGQMSYVKLWMIMLFVLGFWFAVVMVGRGELTPGDALTTFYAVLIAFQSIETLGPQWLILAKGMVARQLLQELVKEGEGGLGDVATGWRKPSNCAGDISMNNVSIIHLKMMELTLILANRSALHTRQTRPRWCSGVQLCGSRPGNSRSSWGRAARVRAPSGISSYDSTTPWLDKLLWTVTPSQRSILTGSAEISPWSSNLVLFSTRPSSRTLRSVPQIPKMCRSTPSKEPATWLSSSRPSPACRMESAQPSAHVDTASAAGRSRNLPWLEQSFVIRLFWFSTRSVAGWTPLAGR